MNDNIAWLKDKLIHHMCKHFIEEGFDKLLSREEISVLITNANPDEIASALRKLIEEGKVKATTTQDPDGVPLFYLDSGVCDAYYKHIDEEHILEAERLFAKDED